MNWQLGTSSAGLWQLTQKQEAGQQRIEFVESVDNLPNIDYQTVLLELKKWDAYWQQDLCNFVPPNLADFPRACCHSDADYQAEITMHRAKIQRWADELRSGSGKVPAVCFQHTLHNGRLQIRQGRHRIAYLRTLDIPCFAAAIPTSLLPQLAHSSLLFSK